MSKKTRGFRALSVLCVLGIAVLACVPAVAAVVARPLDLFDLGAPSFTTFTTRDGLPDPVVVTVRTDTSGFVWAGTQHGLARFDGKRWHRLDNPALQGYVDQLYLDRRGTLWATSRTFGLARYDGSHWHVVGAADGVRRVRRLAETDWHGGTRLWAVTWDAGLFYRENGHWHADPGNGQLPRGALFTLVQTHELYGHERLWVGTSHGLWYREAGGPWHRFRASGFDPDSVEDMLVTHDHGHEALWISAFGGGLWRLDGHGVRGWTVASGDLPSDELYNIVETPVPGGGHAIWVASRAGLIRIHHDRARVFGRRYGLLSNAVRGVRAWRSPNGTWVLWLATESGVARAMAGASMWETVSLLGASRIGVFGVLIDTGSDGRERLWVGSEGDGLGVYDNGRWRYFTRKSGRLPSDYVTMIARADDRRGHPAVWIGMRRGILLRARGDMHFEHVATPWSHGPGQGLLDMISRRVDGRVEQWFATRDSGVYRRRDGHWKAYRPLGASGHWEPRQLLEQVAAGGHSWLWATSGQGLARFDGRRWVLLGRRDGLPAWKLLGMHLLPDAQGRPILWIGSMHHGVVRVDVSDPIHPRMLPANLPPPPDPTVYSALRDSRGRVYVCTNAGVQLLTPDASGYRSRVFTRADGLVNDECNAGAQMLDAHDRYWAGTLGGLSVHDPANQRPDRHPKPLRLTGVFLDGRRLPAGRVRIPPGHHDLRVEYALLSWQHGDASRFRTWLEGFDARPEAWSADGYRDIGMLPPGQYVLHVQARDYAGNLSRPILLPIVVEPRWWQRSGAMIAFILTAIALAYALMRWRMHALRRRQHVLEQRIAGRTADLNEANRQLRELSQRDGLTGVLNRRRLFELLEPGGEGVRRGAMAALIFIDVDHFKSYNDSFGHMAGDQALKAVAETICRFAPEAAVVARYGGEEFACLLFDSDMDAACDVAERIRAGLGGQPMEMADGSRCRVTISAGVACRRLESDEDVQQLIHDADSALYAAKHAGRNCVREGTG